METTSKSCLWRIAAGKHCHAPEYCAHWEPVIRRTRALRIPDTMDALLPAESAALHSSTWVRGPVWDGVWMLNALWLVPVVLWLAHGYSDPESSPLDIFYLGLTALFWIGHRLCSTWLAYCTE